MRTLKSISVLVSLAAGVVSSAAFAMPSDILLRSGGSLVQEARIICQPSGRCFRIDAYGRRILVPRPYGFGGPGFGGPVFGGPVFGGPVYGRPGFGRTGGSGFEGRDGGRAPEGFGRGPRNGEDQSGGKRRKPHQDAGDGQRGGDAGGMQDGGQRQQRGGGQGGQRQRPKPGQPRNGGDQGPNDQVN